MADGPPSISGIEAAAYLHDQARQHEEIRVMLASLDLNTMPDDQLAALADAVAVMNDEAPIYENMGVDDMRDITEIL